MKTPCPTLNLDEGFIECTCPGRKHVRCDENCGAFEEPDTFGEFLAAIEHWKNHNLFHGCSHGR